MPRKYQQVNQASGYTVLLVDDNPSYLSGVCRLLEREGHQVLSAHSGREALNILRQQSVDLLLVDYFMPGMTGEEVVAQLRTFNPTIQIILQTGYASEHPPRELLKRLDIQGYYDKSEGPDKLLLWVDVGLKASYTFQLLNKSREGLRYILNATPEMHRIQPLTDLLQGILWQVSGLLGATNAFLAVAANSGMLLSNSQPGQDGFVSVEEDALLILRAVTGRFVGQTTLEDALAAEELASVREILRQGKISVTEIATAIPLRIGALTLGIIYLDRPAVSSQDIELLEIFANQASVAIQNMQLYEMATLDPLTSVYVRRLFDQWLMRELRNAFRARQPLTLLMLDVDGMKQINDQAGHLAGDQALALVGKGLRQMTRENDVVGRYGGDEFIVLLPQTQAEGAARVGQRIIDFLVDKSVASPQGPVPIRISMGLSVLNAPTFTESELPRLIPAEYFQETARALIQQTDAALYESKRAGGGAIYHGPAVEWGPLTGSTPAP